MDKHEDDKAIFGFWVYLMTDCVLFASLFATYAVLRTSTFGGPMARQLFDLPSVLTETIILLTSSFTCGLAMLAMQNRKKANLFAWLLITLLLGVSFLTLEVSEFSHLIHTGNGPDRSAFLSAFFTLVATHGLHIFAGSVTIITLMVQLWRKGLTVPTVRRLTALSLFWHFLDVIWIFIFSIVYLVGVVL